MVAIGIVLWLQLIDSFARGSTRLRGFHPFPTAFPDPDGVY